MSKKIEIEILEVREDGVVVKIKLTKSDLASIVKSLISAMTR